MNATIIAVIASVIFLGICIGMNKFEYWLIFHKRLRGRPRLIKKHPL